MTSTVKRTITGALFLIPSALWTCSARAQDNTQSGNSQGHEPPAVMQIVVETVKEGRSPAHEKVESDWAAAFRRRQMPHQLALTSMTGTPEAWFLTGFPSFAAVEDNDKTFRKPGIKEEMDALDERDGELRANSRFMYAVYRKDLSYHTDLVNLSKLRYMSITVFRPKLGHTSDFEEGSKKFQEAYEKASIKAPWATYQVISGAAADMFVLLEPMESLKWMDEEPARGKAIQSAMGEDYQRMMKGAGDVFTSISSNLYAVNPRMSYMSKDVEDGDPAFWRSKPAEKAALVNPGSATVRRKTEKPAQ
jgi:hypothetical protein